MPSETHSTLLSQKSLVESSPSKSKTSSSNSPFGTKLESIKMTRARPSSRRTRYLVCLTIMISASLIIIVFLGPLFISSFPSLTDRADILIHKEEYADPSYGMKHSSSSNPLHQYKRNSEYAPAAQNWGQSRPQETQQPDSEQSYFPAHLPSMEDTESAATKLECPAHVVSFVVNATDVKDECDGLRKAFDQTCGGSATRKTNDNNGGFQGSRRRLMDDGLIADSTDEYHDTGFFSNALTWKPVRNYLKTRLMTMKDPGKTRKLYNRVLENEKLVPTEGHDVVKPLSPSLPTTSSEVAESMATDALALNANLEDIAKAIEDIHNKTDATHAVQEQETHKRGSILHPHHDHEPSTAEEEEEELKSTAVAVSAVINNPKTIETQVCCKSILTIFHEECDTPEEEEFNDKRLFVIVCVIALCGMVKSLIRHFQLRWLPEAGGCIIVGMIGGMFLRFLPSMDFGFQHDMFLRVMVPPIG